MSRSWWLPIALGLVLRGSCLLGVEYDQEHGDAASYRLTALTLLDHGVFSISPSAPWVPTAYRPPGYTAFVAAVFAFSRAFLLLQCVQIVLSLAAVWLLSRVARRIDVRLELPVLWLGALNPFDAVYAGAGLSECVTTAVFVALCWALVAIEGHRRWLVMGLLLGVLCLLRDIYLALLPFGLIAFTLFAPGQRLKVLREGVAICAVAAMVIAPWTARNYGAFGKVIPISAGRLGYSLWMGTWALDGSFTLEDASGARTYPDHAFLREEDRQAVAGADPALAEPLFKRLFVERVRAEPVKVVGRWLVRWPRLWFGTRFDIFKLHERLLPYGSMQWKVVKAALFGVNAIFVVAALAGAWLAVKHRATVRFAVLPLAFTAAAYLPLNSFENRYSQPMFPFLTLLAANALATVIARRRSAPAVAP
ncbi:MAG: hypothetical protein JNM17_32955 [Archangium sp.]|nr:hypothetical protein [Archangium sp.]